MTTFTAMALGPESPFTAIEAVALYANPIAITEGAAGAPRILGQAIARAGNGLPVLSVAASDAYDLTEGVVGTVGTLSTLSTAANITAWTFNMVSFTGSIRFRASHQVSGGATSFIMLYKNGAQIFSSSTTNTTPTAVVMDASAAPGDEFIWWHRTSSGAVSSIVSGVAIRASNAYVAQSAWRPAV